MREDAAGDRPIPIGPILIRAARSGEAAALSALVARSKAAHHGPAITEILAQAPELTLHEAELAPRRVVLARAGDEGPPLGVATLEDEPAGHRHGLPEAPFTLRLGLLFVAPEVFGRGLGRRLLRDAVHRAHALGADRLVLDADPHAAGFYRAVGALPAPARTPGLIGFTVPLAPEPGWVRALTGGAPTVHVGNVAEFHAAFTDPSLSPPSRRRPDRTAHHYAALAAFLGPRPAALVLPLTMPPGWVERVGRVLEWEEPPEVYDGLLEGAPAARGLSDLVRSRPALAARVTGRGLPVLGWGHTPGWGRLTGRAPGADFLRYEAKPEAHALFTRLARLARTDGAPGAEAGAPGVRVEVPAQWGPLSARAALRLAGRRLRAGAGSVLRTAYGVGGSGTVPVVDAAGLRRARRVVRGGPWWVAAWVPAGDDGAERGGVRDLTYDGLVDGAGRAHTVGTARMEVVGGAYRGATVGPGAVPERWAAPARRFGAAVGRELAARGYRGWFDVDFVTGRGEVLAPTEVNLRAGGPTPAFVIAARLDALRGAGHRVRTLDRLELGARLPVGRAAEVFEEAARECARAGALFVPTIPTAVADPGPWLGVAVAARDERALDAGVAALRAWAAGLGTGFAH
ncbi:GNAT family N-acetyltransferase (plasmid) [Streptomyces sp. BI20]|uniref:GNAT family N-acetyltransferase n=1 Tax=Streptomyces sp. BI20 TaxID=3403460 RepID=UPI003C789676